MRWGHIGIAALAFLLCFLVSSLSFLAYASPPDPSCGRGVYDDADFDEVIGLMVTNAELIAAPPSSHQLVQALSTMAEGPTALGSEYLIVGGLSAVSSWDRLCDRPESQF